MSGLSPKSDPKRTLLSPSHLITIYEYTPLATYRAACHRWPGIPRHPAAGCASDRGRPALARSIGRSHQQPPRARTPRREPRWRTRGAHARAWISIELLVELVHAGLATASAERTVTGRATFDLRLGNGLGSAIVTLSSISTSTRNQMGTSHAHSAPQVGRRSHFAVNRKPSRVR
jgi:hypothetical protein